MNRVQALDQEEIIGAVLHGDETVLAPFYIAPNPHFCINLHTLRMIIEPCIYTAYQPAKIRQGNDPA
jgi:hypothetical protein